jgi:hypothetical protein
MKRIIRKNVIVSFIIAGMFVALCSFIVNAEPIVEVVLDPEEPAPASTVTFTATVMSEESIEGVWLILHECTTIPVNVCFPDSKQNVSMTQVEGSTTYEANVTLIHDDATYIQYHVEIKSNGGWHATADTDVNLTISENGNGGDTNGDDGANGTPGFEFVGLLVAAFVIILAFAKRKRSG